MSKKAKRKAEALPKPTGEVINLVSDDVAELTTPADFVIQFLANLVDLKAKVSDGGWLGKLGTSMHVHDERAKLFQWLVNLETAATTIAKIEDSTEPAEASTSSAAPEATLAKSISTSLAAPSIVSSILAKWTIQTNSYAGRDR
ncbi:hypothetical protein LTR37_020397 [Vermiconidia calcicola]|uniref:Uncharacterized protein n=1 Tax=Vermiconidia calcicola TaxID=1690605 RepID=A0ACC3MDC4_9PEZI|nr:hypothetical protein LTR37_020397 [Vermiconidia calcicola]